MASHATEEGIFIISVTEINSQLEVEKDIFKQYMHKMQWQLYQKELEGA